jgi:hypothetical protein
MGLDIFFDKRSKLNIGYFRKVNFLVSFFENLGYNLDNCVPIKIKKEDIVELISLCSQVLKNHDKAEELLPTHSGFFFGSTEYDDMYFEDVFEVYKYCQFELLPEFDKLNNTEYITFTIDF